LCGALHDTTIQYSYLSTLFHFSNLHRSVTSVLLVTNFFPPTHWTWRWFSDMFETYVTFLARNEAVWSNLLKGIRTTSLSDVRLFVIQANQDLQWGKKFLSLSTVIILCSGLWDTGLLSIRDDMVIFPMQPAGRANYRFPNTNMHTLKLFQNV
jgi:hypothetical protein